MNAKDKKEETEEQDIAADDTADLDDSVVAEEAVGETIKKLREKLKKALDEKQVYLTGWQRAKADLINARKRDEEDKKDLVKFANESLIAELLSVLESFDVAIGNKEAWEKTDKNWRTGVEYIFNQLKKVLADNGLEEINPLGLPTDPARDEAVRHELVSDEFENHKIIKVFQKGYKLNGKVLRPPKVVVGEYKK